MDDHCHFYGIDMIFYASVCHCSPIFPTKIHFNEVVQEAFLFNNSIMADKIV